MGRQRRQTTLKLSQGGKMHGPVGFRVDLGPDAWTLEVNGHRYTDLIACVACGYQKCCCDQIVDEDEPEAEPADTAPVLDPWMEWGRGDVLQHGKHIAAVVIADRLVVRDGTQHSQMGCVRKWVRGQLDASARLVDLPGWTRIRKAGDFLRGDVVTMPTVEPGEFLVSSTHGATTTNVRRLGATDDKLIHAWTSEIRMHVPVEAGVRRAS